MTNNKCVTINLTVSKAHAQELERLCYRISYLYWEAQWTLDSDISPVLADYESFYTHIGDIIKEAINECD